MTDMIIIGRNTDAWPDAADISVDDEYVSNRHACVARKADGTVWIEDLGSTNGTFVNNVRTLHRQLLPGDVLRVGRTEVEIPIL